MTMRFTTSPSCSEIRIETLKGRAYNYSCYIFVLSFTYDVEILPIGSIGVPHISDTVMCMLLLHVYPTSSDFYFK